MSLLNLEYHFSPGAVETVLPSNGFDLIDHC